MHAFEFILLLGAFVLTQMGGSRCMFVVALLVTLVCLLAPGDQLLAFKLWVYTWLPFASEIDAANATHYSDKVVHTCLFASLGYLAIKGWVQRRQLAWVIAGLVWLAPQTEWAQSYIPGRGASLADVAADVAGLVVGVGWAMWHQHRRARRSALASQNQQSAVQNCA